jgi:hypothetical protein
MLTYSLVFLHENAYPNTAAHTQALLEHFDWELFDYRTYSPNLILSDYHLFTYMKNWLVSQHFNINEELMEGVKMWLSSWVAVTGVQKVIPQYDNSTILAVTKLRSISSIYVYICIFFIYNIIITFSLCLIACFVNSYLEVACLVALVLIRVF